MGLSIIEIGPIFRALLRQRSSALLIIGQCALTLAIVVNAVFIILARQELTERPTGLDTDNIIYVQSMGFSQKHDPNSSIPEDLALLRQIPGVKAVSPINALPLSGGGSSRGYSKDEVTENDQLNAAYYEMDEHGLAALGLNLVAGRWFRPEEVRSLPERTDETSGQGIISLATARKLFGKDAPLGQRLYFQDGQRSLEIIGVVEHMPAAWVHSSNFEYSVIYPWITTEKFIRYAVRAEPGRRDELMPIIEAELRKLNPGRIIRLKTQAELDERAYRGDKAMSTILASVSALIVVITALGIVGLATFSVRRRTRQIGTRRALGASQWQVLRYFLVENWLITSAGVVLGSALAVALNLYLVETYSLERLHAGYLPLAAVLLWLLGWLAVYAPARRASRISPATATRNI